jgi:biotin transport system substrate-specific component
MSQEHESVELVGDETVGYFARAVLIAALTAVLAQLSVPYPFSPAPISFQVIGVYLAGLLLGPLWAGFAFTLYLLVGAVGVPVFANGGSGLAYLAGPTGGFIVSYVLAAVLIGAVVHRRVTPRPLSEVSVAVQTGALFAGLVVIYLVGAPRLAQVQGWTLARGFWAGAIVFVPGDIVKIAATMGLVKSGHLADLVE